MERHQRHLEGEPDEQERHTGQQHRISRRQRHLVGKHRGHGPQIRGSRDTEEQRHAVEEERRGESAEDEVLEPGLAACRALPVTRREQIEGQAECLQSEEHHDQVVRKDHRNAADECSEDQSVGLGGVSTLALEMIVRRQDGHHRRDGHCKDGENREAIEHQRLANQRSWLLGVSPQQSGQHGRSAERDRRQQRVHPTSPLRGQRAHEQQRQRAGDKGQQRAERKPLNRGALERLAHSASPPFASGWR